MHEDTYDFVRSIFADAKRYTKCAGLMVAELNKHLYIFSALSRSSIQPAIHPGANLTVDSSGTEYHYMHLRLNTFVRPLFYPVFSVLLAAALKHPIQNWILSA